MKKKMVIEEMVELYRKFNRAWMKLQVEISKKPMTPLDVVSAFHKVNPYNLKKVEIKVPVAKIDATTALLGISHHDHSNHKVYVDGLTFDEASVLEGEINKIIKTVYGPQEFTSPRDNRTRDEVMSESEGGHLSEEELRKLEGMYPFPPGSEKDNIFITGFNWELYFYNIKKEGLPLSEGDKIMLKFLGKESLFPDLK